MNIHCMDTITILLLVVSLATAQRTWSNIFGHHRNDHYDLPTIIEIQHPKMVRTYDDDYSQPLRHLHLFHPFDPHPPPPPPVIYLPRVYHAPEVYVDDFHPYVHNYRFQEPSYLSRFWTTVSLSYNTKLVRVVDKDEKEETAADSLTSDSSTVEQAVTNSANEPKSANKGTTRKDIKAETTGSSDQGRIKKVTPKANAEAVAKSDVGGKPVDNKTTESTTKVDATKVSENNDKVVESKPVEGKAKAVDNADATSGSTTPKDKDSDGDSGSATTENKDGPTDDADVPVA